MDKYSQQSCLTDYPARLSSHSMSGLMVFNQQQALGGNPTDPAPRLGMLGGRSTSSRTFDFHMTAEEQGRNQVRSTTSSRGLFPSAIRGVIINPFAAIPTASDGARPSPISYSGTASTAPSGVALQQQILSGDDGCGSSSATTATEPSHCPSALNAPLPPRSSLLRSFSASSNATRLQSPSGLPKLSSPGALTGPSPPSPQNPVPQLQQLQSHPPLPVAPAAPRSSQSGLGVRRGNLPAPILTHSAGAFAAGGGAAPGGSGGGSSATPSPSATLARNNSSFRSRLSDVRELVLTEPAAVTVVGTVQAAAVALLPDQLERRPRRTSAEPDGDGGSGSRHFRSQTLFQQRQQQQPQQLYSSLEDDGVGRDTAATSEPHVPSSTSARFYVMLTSDTSAFCQDGLGGTPPEAEAAAAAAATSALRRRSLHSGGLLERSISLEVQRRSAAIEGRSSANSYQGSSISSLWRGDGTAITYENSNYRALSLGGSGSPEVDGGSDVVDPYIGGEGLSPGLYLPYNSTSRRSCFSSSGVAMYGSSGGQLAINPLPGRKPTLSVPGSVSKLRLFQSTEALQVPEEMDEGGGHGESGDDSDGDSDGESGGDGDSGGGKKDSQGWEVVPLDQILDPLLDKLDPGRKVARRCMQRLQNGAKGVGRLRAVEVWADGDASRPPMPNSSRNVDVERATAAAPVMATSAPGLAFLAGQLLKLPCVGLEKLRDPEKRQKVVQRLREDANALRAAHTHTLSNQQRPDGPRWQP